MKTYPNSLRPFDNVNLESEGLVVVCEMIRQVLSVHGPSLLRIHVGCDEVWCLGQGTVTADILAAKGWAVIQVFLRHIAAVAEFVKSLNSAVKVMVWDDMMRTAGRRDIMVIENTQTPHHVTDG